MPRRASPAILLLLLAACGGEARTAPQDAPEAIGVAAEPMMKWALQQQLDTGNATAPPFGASVALSGDTAIVGSSSGDLTSDGPVSVFVRSGVAWTLAQQIIPVDSATGATFGQLVAMSGDTALVGAPEGAGAAYVFVQQAGTWTLQQTLTAGDGVDGDSFGWVAVDGDTAVVGARARADIQGAAYVFVRSGGAWTQQQEIVAADGAAGDTFGLTAVSGDTAIVGAPGHAGAQGAAYVYVRSGSTWSLQQELVAGDGLMGDAFGGAVAIDGDTALVSAPLGKGLGVAYVFTRAAGVWSQVKEIEPASSVAIHGGTAVVGGTVSPPTGPTIVLTLGAGMLTVQGLVDDPTPAASHAFGSAVAVDGRTVIVGAPAVSPFGPLNGPSAAYAFVYASSDGDACAADADCHSEHCVDGVCCSVAACPAAGPCNDAEHCEPGTGVCSSTPIHEGMACSDGDRCTDPDTCQNGVCTGPPTLCTPPDACHEFGACDPATGVCANPAKPDGAPCGGGSCKAGRCVAPASTSPPASGGCGCGTSGSPAGGALAAALALLIFARRPRAGARASTR